MDLGSSSEISKSFCNEGKLPGRCSFFLAPSSWFVSTTVIFGESNEIFRISSDACQLANCASAIVAFSRLEVIEDPAGLLKAVKSLLGR